MARTPYDRALDLLSQRPYTARDLRRKLIQKEIPAADADVVIAQLTEAGLVDDTKYALAYARSKLLGSGASRRRIKQDLARKGVKGDIATEAVEQVIVDEEVDTEALAVRVARKKLASLGDLEPLVLRRRVYAFLARRGYDIDDINRAMQAVFAR